MTAELLGPVEVGPVAHGGHCVARLVDDHAGGGAGRVLFVRHALPGEQVRVRVTDTSHDRYWRADAVEVLQASPDRTPSRCPISGPGGCGGCDFQHVTLPAQRRLKAEVVAEQLRRLAGLDWPVTVEALAGDEQRDGLDWRTRMRYHVDGSGVAGLRGHRSREVIALPAQGCPIAHPRTPDVTGRTWPAGAELVAVAGADEAALLVDGDLGEGESTLTERAGGRAYAVVADGFWQVHPAAADTLVAAVLAGLQPAAGERAFDLYCGVGLFAGALADAGCRVWGLESSRTAVAQARRNLADHGREVRFTADRVERGLARLPARTDLVVLDPPRTGAGRRVVEQVLARQPRAVAYVACDPAALARDLGTAAGLGYRLETLRAFDAFPMTSHVECVAILAPTG